VIFLRRPWSRANERRRVARVGCLAAVPRRQIPRTAVSAVPAHTQLPAAATLYGGVRRQRTSLRRSNGVVWCSTGIAPLPWAWWRPPCPSLSPPPLPSFGGAWLRRRQLQTPCLPQQHKGMIRGRPGLAGWLAGGRHGTSCIEAGVEASRRLRDSTSCPRCDRTDKPIAGNLVWIIALMSAEE
jgi:hypothetical protein